MNTVVKLRNYIGMPFIFSVIDTACIFVICLEYSGLLCDHMQGDNVV